MVSPEQQAVILTGIHQGFDNNGAGGLEGLLKGRGTRFPCLRIENRYTEYGIGIKQVRV